MGATGGQAHEREGEGRDGWALRGLCGGNSGSGLLCGRHILDVVSEDIKDGANTPGP